MRLPAVKVGLIGLGNMGRNHLRVLSMLKGFEISFIADANEATVQALAAQYGVLGVTDPEPLLAGLDALVICTPTVTHAHFVRLGAEHVRNIFVEKPLAANLAEAHEIAALKKTKGLNIQVGFIERFSPAVISLRSVLDQTDQVISSDFTRTNKLSARITDVDVVADLMIHDIDLALYLNGPARSLSAHGLASSGMIDFASALITHESGRFSRIQASRVTDKNIRKIEVTCKDMFVDCDLLRKEIQISRQSETRVHDAQTYRVAAIHETVAVTPQEALLSELQAFLANCRSEGNVDVPDVVAGLHAMELCAQIQGAITK
ncbi:MAG: Gfo/Idh/MocA family protein [Erythrobacter sp.]